MNELMKTIRELYEKGYTDYQLIHMAYNEGVITKRERNDLITEFL